MTPLDIMEALRDVPEDLIDISECRTDEKDEKRVPVQKVIALDWPKAHFREEQVQCKAEDPSRKRNGSAIMSYLMTAGCTAACIAGFALMIRLFTEPVYPEQEISIPSETQNAAVTEITDLTTERTAAVTASQTNTETAAVNTATTAAVLQTDRTSATTAGLVSGTTVHISGTGSRAVSGTAGRTETVSASRRRNGTTTTRATGTTRRMTTTSRITGITTGTTAILTETSAATSETARSVTTTETTAETAPPVPPILLQYCQTLTDGRPLWEAYRELSYHDGLDYTIRTGTDEDPFARTPNLTPFPLTGLYVEIGCAQGAPGETVNVPVYIAGAPDLGTGVMFIDPPDGLKPTAITSGMTEDFELGVPSITDGSWLANGDSCVCGAYLPKGSFTFGLGSLHEIVHLPSDGYVIANYSYQIPEDAQPGTVYPVCLNAAKTVFTARLELADRTITSKDYQYTLLNGVVVVE